MVKNELYSIMEELAEEYAAFTNKDEGWRNELTLKEFGYLRKLALEELALRPTIKKSEEKKGKSRGNKSITPTDPSRLKEKNDELIQEAAKEENNNVEKITPFTTVQEEKRELSREEKELAILLNIKEE